MSDDDKPLHPAVAAVQAQAVARLTDDRWLALATDVATFGGGRRTNGRAGLVAIAYPGASVVLAIDMSEWVPAQLTLLELAGVPPAEAPSAMEAAQEARAALPAKPRNKK